METAQVNQAQIPKWSGAVVSLSKILSIKSSPFKVREKIINRKTTREAWAAISHQMCPSMWNSLECCKTLLTTSLWIEGNLLVTYHYLGKMIQKTTKAKAPIQSTAAKEASLCQIKSTRLPKTSWLKTPEIKEILKVYRFKKENKNLRGFKKSSHQVNKSLLLSTLQMLLNKLKDP